jgi:cation diffusion facilitator CzcD-associated flavoprotein CzcO
LAIIGTGATAIQCVPRVAQHAQHLYVFQRTPSSVDWRGNKPTDAEWWKTLEPGWQRERRENFNSMFTGAPQKQDLVSDVTDQVATSCSHCHEVFRDKRGPRTPGDPSNKVARCVR